MRSGTRGWRQFPALCRTKTRSVPACSRVQLAVGSRRCRPRRWSVSDREDEPLVEAHGEAVGHGIGFRVGGEASGRYPAHDTLPAPSGNAVNSSAKPPATSVARVPIRRAQVGQFPEDADGRYSMASSAPGHRVAEGSTMSSDDGTEGTYASSAAA